MGVIDFECGACGWRWVSHMVACPKCGTDVVKSHMKTAVELGLVRGETKTTLISGGRTNASKSG